MGMRAVKAEEAAEKCRAELGEAKNDVRDLRDHNQQLQAQVQGEYRPFPESDVMGF